MRPIRITHNPILGIIEMTVWIIPIPRKPQLTASATLVYIIIFSNFNEPLSWSLLLLVERLRIISIISEATHIALIDKNIVPNFILILLLLD
jgi:hypothetical protein